jgi:hypothetical protein
LIVARTGDPDLSICIANVVCDSIAVFGAELSIWRFIREFGIAPGA